MGHRRRARPAPARPARGSALPGFSSSSASPRPPAARAHRRPGVGRGGLGQRGSALAAAAQLGVDAEHHRRAARRRRRRRRSPRARASPSARNSSQRLVECLARPPARPRARRARGSAGRSRPRPGGRRAGGCRSRGSSSPRRRRARRAAPRRARSPPRPALELGADPLAQLGRGLVGEGEGEDRVGRRRPASQTSRQ